MEPSEYTVGVYTPNKIHKKVDLSNDLLLEFENGHRRAVVLYRHGVYIKTVELIDKVAKKILVVEVVELGAVKKRISEALEISRQTIDNYLEIKKYFGVEGLIHGYIISDSKSQKTQRKWHAMQINVRKEVTQVKWKRCSS